MFGRACRGGGGLYVLSTITSKIRSTRESKSHKARDETVAERSLRYPGHFQYSRGAVSYKKLLFAQSARFSAGTSSTLRASGAGLDPGSDLGLVVSENETSSESCVADGEGAPKRFVRAAGATTALQRRAQAQQVSPWMSQKDS